MEGSQYKARSGKKLVNEPVSINKLSIVALTCHPNCLGGKGRRIRV
jgi:hypothetical protein